MTAPAATSRATGPPGHTGQGRPDKPGRRSRPAALAGAGWAGASRLKAAFRLVRPRAAGCLAGAAAALAASALWHWEELAALAVGLVSLVAVAALFVIGRTGYFVLLDLARLRVTAGQAALGALEIRNPTGRALLPSNIYLPVGPATAAFRVPRLGPGQVHEESFQIPTTRRSVIPLGPVSSWRGDPFDLVRREITWTEAFELFVHPVTVGLDGSSAGFLRDLEGRPTSDLS
ncbi:MAG: hypothetical protein LBD90_07935, partial [Bifidobacteriaceae bacterium]|nr:hypothetical protein [Bifidobacteriaceae bacterium]